MPLPSSLTSASRTNPTLTQCRSAATAIPRSAAGCSRHSSAPASRAMTLILPAEPCQMLPEKSSAWTVGGRKWVMIDAGSSNTITASNAARTMRITGHSERDRGIGSAARLGERDAGIHHSRPGGAIHGDRLDRESITLIEHGQPSHQRIEGSSLQLYAHAVAIGLRPAQSGGETSLAADAVDQNHGRLSRALGETAAGCANLRSVHLHPCQIFTLARIALERIRHRGMQGHQNSQHQ